MPASRRTVTRARLRGAAIGSATATHGSAWDVLERIRSGQRRPVGGRPDDGDRTPDDQILRDRAVHPRVPGVGPMIAHDVELTRLERDLDLLLGRLVRREQIA